MSTNEYSGTGKCVICDRENVPFTGAKYNARCVDQETCLKNRKTLRIFDFVDLKLDPKYIEDLEKQKTAFMRSVYTLQLMQMADFVVVIQPNGGALFIKDRYEDSEGKVYFAP